MPKTIKEVYTDYTGNTTVEYSDSSTRTFGVDDVATLKSDPLDLTSSLCYNTI